MYMYMAKSQDTIIASLMDALRNGNGDLDELAILMDHVKEDIADAKKEQEAQEQAKKEAERKELIKRGEKIAEMATRVLENKTTAEDVAVVFESYLKAQGIDGKVSASDIEDAMNYGTQFVETMGNFFQGLEELFAPKQVEKPKATVKKATADDILRDFLRNMK